MPFFHFAAIAAAANQDHFFSHVQDDKGFRIYTVSSRVSLNPRHAEHGKSLCISRYSFAADEKVLDEQLVPGLFVDETHRQPVFGVGAGINVGHIHFMGAGVSQHFFVQFCKGFPAAALIAAPADFPAGILILHKKFILGGTPRMLACGYSERAFVSQDAFAVFQRFLHQFFPGKVKYGDFKRLIYFFA